MCFRTEESIKQMRHMDLDESKREIIDGCRQLRISKHDEAETEGDPCHTKRCT